MKKIEKSSVLSLVSMLSIFFAFILVCVLCIFCLSRLDVIDIDWVFGTGDQDTSPNLPMSSGDGVFGDRTELTLNENDLRSILSDVPFIDNYSMRIYATYIGSYGVDGKGGNYKIEAYDVFKSGEKYKIQTYNYRMQPIRTVVCDGVNVSLYDIETNTESLFPASEHLSFSLQAPMPDFSVFQTEKYRIKSFELDGGEYAFVCEFYDMGIVDNIRIDAETGIVTYFTSVIGGKTIFEYTVNKFESDVEFSPEEFAIEE